MESTNPFGVYFNLIKIKYPVYDESLTDLNFLTPTDKVNVFINLETVLNYLSTTKDLEKKLIVNRNFPDYMKADIINIAAHYKDFFKGNGLDCNIFLYMTDLESELEFKENKYIEDYRCYYLMKYRSNPRFVLLGERLSNEIFPEVRTICEFIPNVYFVSGKNIDGGLIPLIIGESMPEYKNLIISADIHDTQYCYEDRFVDHLHIRTYNKHVLECTPRGFLQYIGKCQELPEEISSLFHNGAFYKLLLACMGDKYRSIDSVTGIKLKTMIKILESGLSDGKITKDVKSPALLSDLFPDDVKEQIYNNLSVLDIQNAKKLLSDGDKKQILSQIIDRSDINALHKLNSGRFRNNQLRLESLLK